MSTFESAYPALLQGVSQQIPPERLPGQVTAQVNMLSDAVTGLRRRPGSEYKYSMPWADSTPDNVYAWFTDIAGQRVHILVNSGAGEVAVLSEDFSEQTILGPIEYLQSAKLNGIRGASVANEFFLCNVEKMPVLQSSASANDPRNAGFFYVVAGGFGRTYNVSVVYNGGSLDASYTTPGGTGVGDAALSTPEFIAQQLVQQLNVAPGAGGGSFDRVRLVSWDFDSGTGNVQRNTGSPTSPVWTNLAAGAEVTAEQLSTGQVRLRYTLPPGEPAAWSCEYQISIADVWQTEVYQSDFVRLPWNDQTNETRTLPITVFTSAGVSSTPPVYIESVGPYVFCTRAGGVSISTTMGTSFLIASQNGGVRQVQDLPARLPPAANKYICQVGPNDAAQYYEYNAARTEWLETAKFGSPSSLTNVPISVQWNGTTWELNRAAFEGRLAGDDKSNPAHEFMTLGITGMSTYQGRLVLMSGPLVSLSAGKLPRRFFRSTVTAVIANDPIEVGSGMNSAAAYEWAVQFQKDLILFSKDYQAVLPSNNTAVTPSTATVVPTSAHPTDTTSSPISLGRTLLYCNPRSEDFFGAMEMLPSEYTDSQYTSQDSTPHLPKYFGGRCRFAVSSGVSSIALLGSTGDKQSLFVHEYFWENQNKVQQAWHQWQFPFDMAQAYFVSDRIFLVFVQNEVLVLASIDIKAGTVSTNGDVRPFLDLHFPSTLTANTAPLPAWLFDFANAEGITAVAANGALAGSTVGGSVNGTNFESVESWPSGTILLGFGYYSGVIPTPPRITDYKDNVLHGGKAVLTKLKLGTRNTAEYQVKVQDPYGEVYETTEAPLAFWSPYLQPGSNPIGRLSVNVVPCRTQMRESVIEISTTGAGELNLTHIEYVGKYHNTIKRK